MRDFYSILGVKRDAGADEIKAAWRRQAKSAHPDQNPDDPKAHGRFAEIGHAYDILKDPAKRRRYDQQRLKSDASDRDNNTIMKQREAAQAAAERAKQAKANAERVMAELAQAEAEKVKADTAAAQAAQNARTAQAAATASQAAQSVAQAAAQAAAQTVSQTAEQQEQAKKAKGTKPAEEPQAAGDPASAKAADKPESPEEMVSRIFGEGPDANAAAESLKRERDAAEFGAGNGRTAATSLLSPIELLSSLVRRLRGVPPPLPEKAPDVFAEAIVAIDDLLEQKSVPITLNDGREVRVPLKGVTDGHSVRLREQGLRLPGMNRGDVAVTVRVARSERFIVDGFDIRTVLPITLENAVLGCEIEIDGPEGKVPLTVPAWSNSDQTIRIDDLGLPNGDSGRGALVVELRVMLWEKPDEKVTDLMRLMREGLYI